MMVAFQKRQLLRTISYLYYLTFTVGLAYNGKAGFYMPLLLMALAILALLFLKLKVLDFIVGGIAMIIGFYFTLACIIKTIQHWPHTAPMLVGVAIFLSIFISGIVIAFKPFAKS